MDYSDKFIRAFNHLQKWEGGAKITTPKFDGHTTKWGIIESTYNKYYRGSVTDCTEEQAMHIYYTEFWSKNKLEEVLNDSLAELIFQGCVNQGNYGYLRNCVQYPLGLIADAIVGRQTLGKLNAEPKACFDTIVKATKERYEQIAHQNGKQKFLKGWLNRLADYSKFKENKR